VGKKAKKIGEYRLPDKERYDQEAVKEKPSTKDHEQAIVLTASCLILLAAPHHATLYTYHTYYRQGEKLKSLEKEGGFY
jgi:hypothetical protein